LAVLVADFAPTFADFFDGAGFKILDEENMRGTLGRDINLCRRNGAASAKRQAQRQQTKPMRGEEMETVDPRITNVLASEVHAPCFAIRVHARH
jgi:hypothetical protein